MTTTTTPLLDGNYRVTTLTLATYVGAGEFYSGLRNGDRVTACVEQGFYPDGSPISGPRMTVQGIGERAGAWLSVHNPDLVVLDAGA